MSRHGLDRGDGDILRRCPPDRLDRLGLAEIVHVRGRAMCIDIVDVLGAQPCIIECQLHALCLILAVRRRARDMIAVRVRAVADELCIDMCTA